MSYRKVVALVLELFACRYSLIKLGIEPKDYTLCVFNGSDKKGA